MNVEIETTGDPWGKDLIQISFPTFRGIEHLPVEERRRVSLQIVKDQLYADHVLPLDAQWTSPPSDHFCDELTLECLTSPRSNIAQLRGRLEAAFSVTDSSSRRVASGLAEDNREYLRFLGMFPGIIETKQGPMKTWVFTKSDRARFSAMYEQYDRLFVKNNRFECGLGTTVAGATDERSFSVMCGPSEEEPLGIMKVRELKRGWPVECVSELAPKGNNDYRAYRSDTGIAELIWLESSLKGKGIAQGLVRALQTLPYEMIELIEGSKVPAGFYEKLGFVADREEGLIASNSISANRYFLFENRRSLMEPILRE